MSGASLGELAVRFGCTLRGDPDVRVFRVGTLANARPDSISFLANARYRRFLRETKAAAVVLTPDLAAECPVPALLSANPYATYARIARVLHPGPVVEPGRHPTAVVDPTADIDASASIGPRTVIGARARIGARALIGPGSVVMDDAQVGADTRLVANVTLCTAVVIGERGLLHPGAVVGADGFGFAPDRGQWVKIPQVGSVRIGNDVEIGACTGVSGSAIIGQRCMIGGMVGIAGQLTICDDVVITGKSFVSGSINKPGYYSSGLAVDETTRFRKNAARFHRLDETIRELRKSGAEPEPRGEDE